MIKNIIKWFNDYILGNGILKNKKGKIVFVLYDGETTWYLGDNEEQVKKYHIYNSGIEEDEIEYINPMLIKEARGEYITEIDEGTKMSFMDAIECEFHGVEVITLACTGV
jgi:hypothetical protein